MAKLYKDMTPAERQAAYADQAEAHEVHVQGFARRPYRGSYDDRRAERHDDQLLREMGFILRVAKSCGDDWAKGLRS